MVKKENGRGGVFLLQVRTKSRSGVVVFS